MRAVSLSKYLTITIMAVFNIGYFIYSLIDKMPTSFIHLTHWSYWGSTVYLCCICFCDSMLFLKKIDQYEKINLFIRNTYSRFCYSFGYSVVILYWFFVCLGEKFMPLNLHPTAMFNTIYLHGIITIMILIDLILNTHEVFPWSFDDVLMMTILFLLYCLIALIAKYGFKENAYKFMETASIWQLILAVIGLYALVITAYVIHLWVIRARNNHCYIMKEPNKNDNRELIITQEMN